MSALTAEDLAWYREAERRGLLLADPLEQWCPHNPTPKQQEFLALDCLEALYGGAAGGGKSDCLLMGALQHVDQPGYAALILRRTFKDLALPGAIMDRAGEWLAGSGAHWNAQEKTWTFPSGARIAFGYLETERDKYRYQGAEFQYIAFDELTQFSETQYTYLLSRLRRVEGLRVPLRMRAASNPGGIGHKWVYERFIKSPAASTAFVPATLIDNPHIDRESYEISLQGLDEITKRQLKDGEWIQDSTGLVYKVKPRNLIDRLPERLDWRYVLAVDFGSSERTPTTAFAVGAFCYQDPAAYLVHTHKQAALTVSSIAEHVRAYEQQYGSFERIIGDQGALGSGYIKELRQRFGLPITGAQKVNKLGYRKLFNGALDDGHLLIVERENSDFLDETNELIWNEAGTDNEPGQANHASDAALYMWREIKSYLAQVPAQQPKPGTAKHYDLEEERKKQALIDKIQEERSARGRSAVGRFR